jgi:hypothetical protein
MLLHVQQLKRPEPCPSQPALNAAAAAAPGPAPPPCFLQVEIAPHYYSKKEIQEQAQKKLPKTLGKAAGEA